MGRKYLGNEIQGYLVNIYTNDVIARPIFKTKGSFIIPHEREWNEEEERYEYEVEKGFIFDIVLPQVWVKDIELVYEHPFMRKGTLKIVHERYGEVVKVKFGDFKKKMDRAIILV